MVETQTTSSQVWREDNYEELEIKGEYEGKGGQLTQEDEELHKGAEEFLKQIEKQDNVFNELKKDMDRSESEMQESNESQTWTQTAMSTCEGVVNSIVSSVTGQNSSVL